MTVPQLYEINKGIKFAKEVNLVLRVGFFLVYSEIWIYVLKEKEENQTLKDKK